MEVAVLGGGHGCYAAAADAAEGGHNVRFWRRNAVAFSDVLKTQRVIVSDKNGRRSVSLALATNDIKKAIDGAKLIICPLPANAQLQISNLIAPHLVDGQIVFIPPGTFGTFLMAHEISALGNTANTTFAESGTLPWLVRKQSDDAARITARTTRLPTGVFPAKHTDQIFDVIRQVFPSAEKCQDTLDAALLNYGPIIHPPLILMNAGPLGHFEAWDIHAEGTQETIRNVQNALDDERVKLREALGYGPPHFRLRDHYEKNPNGETMYPIDSHDDLIDSSDWREHIDLRSHRYMIEDVALGLALLVSIGNWLNIPCPVATGLLSIGGAAVSQNFQTTGRTFESLKLSRIDAPTLKKLLYEGLHG